MVHPLDRPARPGPDATYPPVLFVFNQLGVRNPERTTARLAALTRHLWAGDKDYEADFHHYDKKVPVITTTLAGLREHGPHGQVFRRFGPQTLFDAIGNPRRRAALERHWAQQQAREREAQERERQEAEQRAAEREAQRPACARCGSMFTDERWKAARATDWGTPADGHPTLCDRCKRRALVAVQLAQTLHHRSERHDQEDHQEQTEPARKPGRWFSRRRA
ncbi:hypothetical protein [Streptomyces sp. NPDC001665]